MSEQLNQAYKLIKEGQKQEAIELLEPLIREDRNNEDAWWMLANATNDEAAKRNALNNVLRLTSNETRKTKAETLLQQLDDPFDFDIDVDVPASSGLSAYQELDDVPQKKSGGLSCATISLILVGIIGVCACAGIFAIGSSAGGIMQAVTYPQSYNNTGSLEDDSEFTGVLSEESPRDGYSYSGNTGDQIIISLDYESIISPLIVIFEENTDVPPTVVPPETSGSVNFAYALPSSGDYLIMVNGFKFLGQEFGFGEYSMEIEIR